MQTASQRSLLFSAVQPSETSASPSERPSTALQGQYTFAYDRVFGPESLQADVYIAAVRPIVLSSLEGYNGSIIAYGQTGTGKTHTIEGMVDGEERGIIPRAAEEVSRDLHVRLLLVHPNHRMLDLPAHSRVIREGLAVPCPRLFFADIQRKNLRPPCTSQVFNNSSVR